MPRALCLLQGAKPCRAQLNFINKEKFPYSVAVRKIFHNFAPDKQGIARCRQ